MPPRFECPLCAAGGTTYHENAHRLLHDALQLSSLATKDERTAFVKAYRDKWGDEAARDLVNVGNVVRAYARRKEEDAVRS